MASIKDVAKRAGCSATLVSRVINHQPGVSEEKRERIQAAINELGYTQNLLARSLVLKKTNTIGVVLDTLCDEYFFSLIEGIEARIDHYGYDVLFCSGRNSPRKKSNYINFFMKNRVDGIIIYGSKLDDMAFIEKLVNSGFPFALIENDVGTLNANNILLNNEYGSSLAVDHLFDCGCRNICYVAGEPTIQAAQRRRIGYVEAMKRHGVPESDLLILESGWTEEEGYETFRKYLKSRGKRALPDAFYFGSDQTAFGGMKALMEAGISVPDEVMLVGYDDDKPRHHDLPYLPLTTIRQPLEEMGRAAVDILMEDLNGSTSGKKKLMYYPSLVIRETTCRKQES